MKKKLPSRDKIIPRERKKYIIQRIEDKEDREENVNISEDTRPPFEMENKDFVGNNLIDRFGPGRYRIISINEKTGKETTLFLGDVEKHTGKKVWTKKERNEYTRVRRSTNKIKLTTVGYYLAISLILTIGVFYSLYTMNIPLLITAVVLFSIFLLVSILVMNLAFYETE